MGVKDLMSLGEGRVRQLLEESAAVAHAPRRFLDRVSNEIPSKTLYRIAVLAGCFSVLQLSVIGVAFPGRGALSTLDVVGYAVGQVALGLVFVPAFFVVAKYLTYAEPLRVAFAYAVTFRLVWFVIPLSFMYAFLLTENYAFALLKGIAGWAYLILLVLLLPFSGARTRKQRLIAPSTCVLLCACIIATMDAVQVEFRGVGANTFRTVFDAPIGSEVDDARLDWVNEGPAPTTRDFFTALETVRGAERKGDILIGRGLHESLSLIETWPSRVEYLDSVMASEIHRLKRVDSAAVFATTRSLVQANIAAIEAGRNAAQSSLSLLRKNGSDNALDAYSAYISALEVSTASTQLYLVHATVRTRLLDWRLMFCGCGR